MGTFTSLRGVVEVSPKYLEIAQRFTLYFREDEFASLMVDYPFISEYFKTENTLCIPNDNDLNDVFRHEQEFFRNRLEGNIFYFRSDLKNQVDEMTGLSPVQSFFENILQNISTNILLLETQIDVSRSVDQYNFSTGSPRKIERLNTTNTDKDSIFEGYPQKWTEDEIKDIMDDDIFEKYKVQNNLEVFS